MTAVHRYAAALGVCVVVAIAGCGGEVAPADSTPEPRRFDCEGFTPPPRLDTSTCSDVDANQPEKLVACVRGSGHLGRWAEDAVGLPAYDFTVEQRCDPVAHAYSPRQTPLRDPIHVIGNGRGLVAMAHASGGVEIYTQDRGHKWINHVDTWADPLHPDYPLQLGGGFNYYTAASGAGGRRVGSTRFEDLPVNRATQQGGAQRTPWRFPYATTGVGAYTDVLIYDQRSDAYYFLPTAIGRYVGLTRDTAFLDRSVPFYPRASGEGGDVIEHLRRAIDYGTDTLGFGARGIVAIGTGDYADGITALATEPATPSGTSSTYNAGAVVAGFPAAADIVELRDPILAARMRDLAASQADALNQQAWEGHYFYRGFVDSGNPLAPQIFFLEPQVLPVLAGIVDSTRRDLALNEVVQRLETSTGALSNVTIGPATGVGGPDRPLVGGIWPVANAWLTGAYARRDFSEAWSSFIRNTLAAHAEKYPDLWYGIWTGPDSFNGPDNARPGEADAHLVTALTDYPALNAHMHTSPLRALVDLVGIVGTRDGLRITPRVPTETFAVEWPRLRLRSAPSLLEGRFIASSTGPLVMELALPSGLRDAAAPWVSIDGVATEAQVFDGLVRFVLSAWQDVPVSFRIE